MSSSSSNQVSTNPYKYNEALRRKKIAEEKAEEAKRNQVLTDAYNYTEAVKIKKKAEEKAEIEAKKAKRAAKRAEEAKPRDRNRGLQFIEENLKYGNDRNKVFTDNQNARDAGHNKTIQAAKDLGNPVPTIEELKLKQLWEEAELAGPIGYNARSMLVGMGEKPYKGVSNSSNRVAPEEGHAYPTRLPTISTLRDRTADNPNTLKTPLLTGRPFKKPL